jgi:hypothetical protein
MDILLSKFSFREANYQVKNQDHKEAGVKIFHLSAVRSVHIEASAVGEKETF